MRTILLVILCYLSFIPQAFAYLDPGSGSYMYQLIIGLFVGGLFSIKLFWQSLVSFFSNIFGKKDHGA